MSSPPRAATLTALIVLAAAAGVAIPKASAIEAAPTGDSPEVTPVNANAPAVAASNESNASVDAWRVPPHVDVAAANATELERYYEPGNRTSLRTYDHLAIAVDAPGIDASVANRTGNRSERVFAALYDTSWLAVVQTAESTGTSFHSAVLWLNASNTRAVDAGDDRYVLIVDVDDTAGIRDGQLVDGDRSFADAYRRAPHWDVVSTEDGLGMATFTVSYRAVRDSPVVAESRPVTVLPDDFYLEPSGSRVTTATTNATVELRAMAPKGEELRATASADGRVLDRDVVRAPALREPFTATFDLSDVEAPATLNVSIERVGRPDEEPGRYDSVRVRVRQPNASVDAWRVPASVDAANASASDLESYQRSGIDEVLVTPRDRLAVGVHVPGLDDAVAAESGNRTERVLDALAASGHFTVRRTRDTTSPQKNAASLWLNASNTRAVPAGEDRYVLVVDPERVLGAEFSPFTTRGTFAETYAAGNESYRFTPVTDRYAADDEYTARYYVNDTDAGLVATSERARFVRATASVDDAVPLEPAANATVAGETTVAPGTELVVTASDDDGVVATDGIRVTENGTFAATLDLAALGQMTVLNVTVAPASNRSRVLAATDRLVLEPDADLAFDDRTSTTRYVSVRASLTHGGVLVLRNDTAVVDVSTDLDPGVEQTVTFTLPDDAANGTYTVVAYRGQPDDPGRQYANGTATARLEFAPDEDALTTTTGGTAPTSDATTGTTPTTATTRTEPRTTPVAQPGFGAAVALGALATLLGTVLAGRKRGDDR